MMLGQERLKREICELIDAWRFPRFSIIVGERGSELKEVPHFVSDTMMALNNKDVPVIELSDNKVGTVRDYIDIAYKQTFPIIYTIVDGDNMSAQAVNALLKITEEPPNSAFFIMLAENEANLLETIKSRAYIFRMGRYTSAELYEYAYDKYGIKPEIEVEVCTTPGEIDVILQSRMSKGDSLAEYTHDFIEEVISVSGARAFTLLDNVSVKDDDGKYDISLFFKFIQYHFLSKANKSDDVDEIAKCCKSVIEAGFALKDLSIKGINKRMLLDNFVLNVRRIWR